MKVGKDLIASSIDAATDFEQIRVLFQEDCTWDCDEGEILSSVTKAMGLVATFEQGHCLQDKLATDGDNWNNLIEKMIELAQDPKDLDLFINDYFDSNPLYHRNILRKVFDKADQLGYKSI